MFLFVQYFLSVNVLLNFWIYWTTGYITLRTVLTYLWWHFKKWVMIKSDLTHFNTTCVSNSGITYFKSNLSSQLCSQRNIVNASDVCPAPACSYVIRPTESGSKLSIKEIHTPPRTLVAMATEIKTFKNLNV